MNVLVIVGSSLQVNSSAVLCHRAYISGLLACGHEVDLITADDRQPHAPGSLPALPVHETYGYPISLYEKLSMRKSSSGGSDPAPVTAPAAAPSDPPRSLVSTAKQAVRSLYGVYGLESAWMRHACRFSSGKKYDVVLSLSYPPASHRLAERLLKMGRIKADRWIQIWEDPWYADLYGHHHTEKVRREEARIVSKADLVYYVTPLTLLYQGKTFSESRDRMRWQPLPSYYVSAPYEGSWDTFRFGYFGDYVHKTRNLTPFYEAAVKMGLPATICGGSDRPFVSTDTVSVYPRMPLAQLAEHEAITNVLVFVCNLQGGQVPGKIYQYSSSNRVILFILDGTEEEKQVLRDYFSQFDRYVFCENDVDSIKAAIRQILAGNFSDAQRTPLTCFEPAAIVSSILEGK